MWLSVSSSAKYYTCLSALPVYPLLCLSIPFITIYFFFLSFFLLSLPYLAIFSFFHAIRSFFLAFVLSSLLFSYHFLKFHPISVLSFIFSFFLFFYFSVQVSFCFLWGVCVCVCALSRIRSSWRRLKRSVKIWSRRFSVSDRTWTPGSTFLHLFCCVYGVHHSRLLFIHRRRHRRRRSVTWVTVSFPPIHPIQIVDRKRCRHTRVYLPNKNASLNIHAFTGMI